MAGDQARGVMRLQQLIDDHEAQLNRLRNSLHEEMTAHQARQVLFTRELSDVEQLLATGETLAHINYLWHRDEITRSHQEDGQQEGIHSKRNTKESYREAKT